MPINPEQNFERVLIDGRNCCYLVCFTTMVSGDKRITSMVASFYHNRRLTYVRIKRALEPVLWAEIRSLI